MTWKIDTGCPQCGAPATLDESDRLLACPYCRTRLYLIPEGGFRYHLPPAGDGSEKRIYLPYWRVRGAHFSVTAAGIEGRFTDTSRLAADVTGAPFSLGLRPQTLRVRFLTPETAGRFVPPVRAASAVLPAPATTSPGPVLSTFIGETTSLLYAPFHLRGDTLHDAILGRPIGTCLPGEGERLLAAPPAPPGRVRFVPALCPRCGWDLEGERGALVLLCRHCDSAWHCPGRNLTSLAFSIQSPPSGSGPVDRYLPFWRLLPRFQGIELQSRADLIRLANLPRLITPALEASPLHFWAPAFKTHPALWARWARQMTVFSPPSEASIRWPQAPLHAVTLPLAEAVEGVVLTLAQLIPARHRDSLLAGLRVTLGEAHLEYHPFLASGRELRHPRLRVVLDPKALDFDA